MTGVAALTSSELRTCVDMYWKFGIRIGWEGRGEVFQLVYNCQLEMLSTLRLWQPCTSSLSNDQDIPCFHKPCIFVPFEPFPHDHLLEGVRNGGIWISLDVTMNTQEYECPKGFQLATPAIGQQNRVVIVCRCQMVT